MLATIIRKEILEAALSLRFLIAMLLCLVLIPLGTYVNLKEYEQRRSDHQESTQLYQQRSKGNISHNFPAEGYRPPSVLSIFATGLEYFLPNKVVTSRDGNVRMLDESGISNPESLLFGKTDLLFNVSVILSLLAFIFTFNMVSGEREEGTLRLMMSNPVPRWQILLGKLIGNYLVFLIPFLLSIIIALLILSTSGSVALFSLQMLPSFLTILLASLLFILSMFMLGMLISTLTYRSITSMVVLLFLWTILALSLPKISPMLAEVIYPVKSQQVLDLQKRLIRRDIEKELDQKLRELYDQVVGTTSGFGTPQTEEEQARLDQYNQAKVPLEEEYHGRMAEEIRKIEEDYVNRRNVQGAIARNFSRLSPVSCYTYFITEISGTGTLEMANLRENAERFQQTVKETIYDSFIFNRYGGTSGSTMTMVQWADGFNPSEASVPYLQYRLTTMSDALQAEWVDIVLLVLFNAAFFIASYVRFIRYDVR